MKFFSPTLLAVLGMAVLAASDEECTRGMLLITDTDSTALRGYDLDGTLENIQVAGSLTLAGNNGQYLQHAGTSGITLGAVDRGTEENFYADGSVSFVTTGVELHIHDGLPVIHKDEGLSLIANAAIDCARPIHLASHDNKVAVFCDGSYDAVPQLNSTVWVVDESLFGSATQSAIVYTETLQGSHHGVAVPVDDNHVMYSLALDDRINRINGVNGSPVSALPTTFQVVDYDGNVLHSLDDEIDPNASCSGFHGSSAIDNTIALACDADHGGIVVVDYNQNTAAYASRALSYPVDYTVHRTGTLVDHPKSSLIIGNFAGATMFHLMILDPAMSGTQLQESSILELEARPCKFDFEQSEGEHVLVWLANGVFRVYAIDPAWSLVAEITVLEGMESCAQGSMTPGYGQAFVTEPLTQKLYSLDLTHVDHGGSIEVAETALGFTPVSSIVSGVPVGGECSGHDGDFASAGAWVKHLSFAGATLLSALGMLF